jgi:hypothetical protein
MKTMLARIGLLLLSLVLSLAITEVLVRAFTYFPVSFTSNKAPDPELLYTLDPRFPEVDQNGFRNPEFKDTPQHHVDIAALGDSHTFGTNVSSDSSWPKLLGKRLGKSVYNFGVPSYGVYQYERLFYKALQLNPQWIIIALYPANDLDYNCDLLDLPYWQRRFSLDLKFPTTGPCVRQRQRSRAERKKRPSVFTRMGEWLTNHSAAVSLVSYYGREMKQNWSDYHFIFGKFKTNVSLKRTEEHQNATDLRLVWIRTHFDNSLILFDEMAKRAQRAGVHLGVLVIPSQERVVMNFAAKNGIKISPPRPPSLQEEALTKEYLKFFASHKIPVVDALDSMVELLSRAAVSGEPVYPNGHPLANGYGAYASAAEQLLQLSP